MALFAISYDLRKTRNYQPIYDQLGKWGAKRLLESYWLADINTTAGHVRDVLAQLVDGDDGVAVIELHRGSNWATLHAQTAGVNWLQQKVLA